MRVANPVNPTEKAQDVAGLRAFRPRGSRREKAHQRADRRYKCYILRFVAERYVEMLPGIASFNRQYNAEYVPL